MNNGTNNNNRVSFNTGYQSPAKRKDIEKKMITGLNIENLKVGNKTKLKKLVYMMLTTLKKENKLAWKMIVGNYFNNKQQRGKNE
jgi:hypothetical protein